MSYDAAFKVKVQDKNYWISLPEYNDIANITYNVSELIRKSTSLNWQNGDMGLLTEVVPAIAKGKCVLIGAPDLYKNYESPNGYGSIDETIMFFKKIVDAYAQMRKDYPELIEIAHLWIS